MPYNPEQPRDPKGTETGGQWTGGDAGDAIKKAASDTILAYAPHRSRNVNTLEEDQKIRDAEDYRIYQEMISELAAGLGVTVENKVNSWGGYIDSETHMPVQEVSNIIHIDAVGETADFMAAVIGKTAPEQQDAVLVNNHDANGSGYEYTIKTGSFDKARKALPVLQENNLQYFSINKDNGDIILLDMENTDKHNVLNFVTSLRKNGLYEKAVFSRTNAKFIGSSEYDEIIKRGGDRTRTKNGFNVNALIEKTQKRYKKVK